MEHQVISPRLDKQYFIVIDKWFQFFWNIEHFME